MRCGRSWKASGPSSRTSCGPLVEFSQPILAERGDPITGQDKRTNLTLGAFKRDHELLALRLVGRADLDGNSSGSLDQAHERRLVLRSRRATASAFFNVVRH